MHKKRKSSEKNWRTLVSFFPAGGEDLAAETGAHVRLRGVRSVAGLLRTLLLHVARGYALREPVVRARIARLARVSEVALLKRLRSAEGWCQALGVALLQAPGGEVPQDNKHLAIRWVDRTTSKEPGKTGRMGRGHYRVRVPEFCCASFTLPPTTGVGTGASLPQFASARDDPRIADRGYGHGRGIAPVGSNGGALLGRLNTQVLPLFTPQGRRGPLLRPLAPLGTAGHLGEGPGWGHGAPRVSAGRLWAMRKTEEASKRAEKQLRRKAAKKGEVLQPDPLESAKYVSVFTPFAPLTFRAVAVLHWDRLRWQVALLCKRLKALAPLGPVPKSDTTRVRGPGSTANSSSPSSLNNCSGGDRRFPPAGQRRRRHSQQTHWREFAFALPQSQPASEPGLTRRAVLASWPRISRALTERPRRRKMQVSEYTFSLS
jgi:hypothetical protein